MSTFKILTISLIFVIVWIFSYLGGVYAGKRDYDNLIGRDRFIIKEWKIGIDGKPKSHFYYVTKEVEREIRKAVMRHEFEWIVINGGPTLVPLIGKEELVPVPKKEEPFKWKRDFDLS